MISAVIGLLLLATPVFADTNNVSPFKANEFSVSASTSYAVDRVNPFRQDYSANVNVGMTYFLTRYVGIDAVAPIAVESEDPFSNVSVGFLARLPLGQIAPYAGLAGRYNFSNYDEKYQYVAKAGLEIRPAKHLGLFVEGAYVNKDLNFNVGEILATVGARFIF